MEEICEKCGYPKDSNPCYTRHFVEQYPLVAEPVTLTQSFDAEIAGLVNTERQAVYGHPLENFSNISAIWDALEGCADPEIKVALYMIGVKLERLMRTPDHYDSVLDIAGYARCILMILDKRAEK